MFVLLLCDSLLTGHKSSGIHLQWDGESSLSCLCIASGGALVMAGGDYCPHSAVALAMKAPSEPAVYQQLATDPTVRVLVLRAAMSTAKCRSHGEQFPKIVKDRQQSPLIQGLETPWSVCDLEDVIMQRPDRTRFEDLEACSLRNDKGIYGQKDDDLHFRKDIAVAAGNELLKALRRTAAKRYPDLTSEGNQSILLVLAAGWNADGGQYDCLDSDGHCWRKTELVALADLCALNGHPFSCFNAKFHQLHKSCKEEHIPFIFQDVRSITALSSAEHPPKKLLAKPSQQLLSLKRPREASQAEELAEITGLPLDTAEGIIAAAGGLSKALELPMFRPSPPIDRDHWPSPSGKALEELVQMGFSRSAAESALHGANGNLSQAVEVLLST
eukprot:Skav230277  [mRNA]  locus=scaffold3387:579145:580302:- [translate_table: standard]